MCCIYMPSSSLLNCYRTLYQLYHIQIMFLYQLYHIHTSTLHYIALLCLEQGLALASQGQRLNNNFF